MGKRQSTIQNVYSEPRKILIGRTISIKGQALLRAGKIDQATADSKYSKNRYRINPDAVIIKQIKHKSYPQTPNSGLAGEFVGSAHIFSNKMSALSKELGKKKS